MPLKVIAQPSGEQISLADARLHLRLDDDGDSPPTHPDDPWLSAVGIPAAREYCEGDLARALAPQTLELALESFDAEIVFVTRHGRRIWHRHRHDVIELPMSPVRSVTSVKYTDTDGTERTLDTTIYDVDLYSAPARIVLAFGASWPATQDIPNAVKIRYEAGYTLPGDSPDTDPLPAALRAAMLLVLGALYENREDQTEARLSQIPLGAMALMAPYRLRLGMA